MKAPKYRGYLSPFAERLRNLMDERDHTQQNLADAIGSNRQSVSQYMDGSILPRADKLAAMADFFGVSCDYLMGKHGSRAPENEEIREMLGLPEPAIEALKTLRKNVGDDFSYLATLHTVNILLTTPEGMNVLELLNHYFWGDYSVGYKSSEDSNKRRNGISELFFQLTAGYPMQITSIPMIKMRETVLLLLMNAVADMRPACENFKKRE